jgi:arginyl-tRNA synthetase
MTNLFSDFRRLVVLPARGTGGGRELAKGLDLSRVAVEPPRDPSHGDLATNAAMVLAGAVKEPPLELAARIVTALGGGGAL